MEPPGEKPLVFLGTALDDLRAFPVEARRTAGFQLHRVQQGQRPTDFKPMPSVGRGVEEIRIRDAGGAFRVFYVARFAEAVYVLHAFEKKTQKTNRRDLAMGKRRYQLMLNHRANADIS